MHMNWELLTLEEQREEPHIWKLKSIFLNTSKMKEVEMFESRNYFVWTHENITYKTQDAAKAVLLEKFIAYKSTC